ncbi:hypothetical protein NHX12_002104 [Muraenolepis orangiensis]|uniref:SAND domain-containing protein n=1 Tax=Muraenolepis orangiensis TaxID=630683 RepID=A0A9Q0E275_9TELE|nr:hypothetical protein NHX12_002104 [Muraenolepis orangiensis]
MDGAEVTLLPPGEVMVVKEEDTEVEEEEDEEEEEEVGGGGGGLEEDSHKTRVILHLHPVLHGVNDDMSTTVLAIEAHHGSDDSGAQGEEIEYGYPITCGDSKAVLLFKKFVCPGINVRCVKFHEQLISPKQFVHLAGKATLKDWKRAIRLGGVMLRKMMDSGQIDFHQHDTVCTNTCRSTKSDVLVKRLQDAPASPSAVVPEGLGGQLVLLQGETLNGGDRALEQKFTTASELSSGLPPPVTRSPPNGLINRRKRPHAPDATMLHSLCEMLGLLDSVEKALDQSHTETDHQTLGQRHAETDHQRLGERHSGPDHLDQRQAETDHLDQRQAETDHLDQRQAETDHLDQRRSHPEDNLTRHPLSVADIKTGDQRKNHRRAQTHHRVQSLRDAEAPPPAPALAHRTPAPHCRRHTRRRRSQGVGGGTDGHAGGEHNGRERRGALLQPSRPPRTGSGENRGGPRGWGKTASATPGERR